MLAEDGRVGGAGDVVNKVPQMGPNEVTAHAKLQCEEVVHDCSRDLALLRGLRRVGRGRSECEPPLTL